MNLRFDCPNCHAPAAVTLTASRTWKCPACDHALPLSASDTIPLPACAACGCQQLYRQKNFPHWLGLSILTVACLAFFALQGLYEPRWAWLVLIGTALFDGVLYLFVGDAVLCYRCGARHVGLPKTAAYDPFELATAEKYRQERIRREQAHKSV